MSNLELRDPGYLLSWSLEALGEISKISTGTWKTRAPRFSSGISLGLQASVLFAFRASLGLGPAIEDTLPT